MLPTAASDKKIYADYAALTPIDQSVLSYLVPYYGAAYGNPSSLHASGRLAHQLIDDARASIARLIGAAADEIIFTGSGTESDNLAIMGIARAHRAHGTHVIISSIEHKAVMATVQELEREGFRVSIVSVDQFGLVNIDELLKLITNDTILISVMYVNNEIGTVQPIRELSEAIRAVRVGTYPLFHSDACQAPNLFSIDVQELGIDLMTLNSTKVYGPQGVGLLYKRSGIAIMPVMVGGEQEHHVRAGTQNLPLIVGFAEALALAAKRRAGDYKRMKRLHHYFVVLLRQAIPDIEFNGHPIHRTPAITHVTIPHIEGESMLLKLDHAGIAVSTGSACSAFDLKPSHVLLAIGQDPDLVHGSIRFSFGRSTTIPEIDYIVSQFKDIVYTLKKMSAL